MRSVSPARIVTFGWSCAPPGAGLVIAYERTTIMICCK
jgi:hypothetical protein